VNRYGPFAVWLPWSRLLLSRSNPGKSSLGQVLTSITRCRAPGSESCGGAAQQLRADVNLWHPRSRQSEAESATFRKKEESVPLNIKSAEADSLARDLARRRGQSITEAIIGSLKESLAREAARPCPRSLAEDLLEIGRHCAALPDLDTRSPEEIIGFDEHGIPR